MISTSTMNDQMSPGRVELLNPIGGTSKIFSSSLSFPSFKEGSVVHAFQAYRSSYYSLVSGSNAVSATESPRAEGFRRWKAILDGSSIGAWTGHPLVDPCRPHVLGEHGASQGSHCLRTQMMQEPIAWGACGLASANDQTSHMRQLIPTVAYQAKEQQTLGEALRNAGKKALGGGIPGAAAMAIQVLTLMWMRTTINYQYRYGMTTTQALKHLYKEGGIVRFYRGLGPALLQGPLSRFGDTAANSGVLALLESSDTTKNLPVGVKTLAASAAAGTFRIFLMPVDALKTIMQVEGKAGLPALMAKVRKSGPTVLYHGALAASAATFVGHYPWFATYNYLNATLPQYDELPKKLLRSAFIGFCSSAISDTVSNSIRVVKTTRQTATEAMTYPQVVRSVIASDGIMGLLGRGLKTKIIANGMQGLLFSVLWRLGQDYYNRKETEKHD